MQNVSSKPGSWRYTTFSRLLPLLLLFIFCLIILVRTIVPTIYTLDSAEFIIGAENLGIVHAPGYALYLLILHLFMRFPIGDPGYRGNLLSAVCLALTAPVLYGTLWRLSRSIRIAAATTLIFVWSFYVWLVGLFTEVYAPQIFTLALCSFSVVYMCQNQRQGAMPFVTGALFGLGIAINPTSIFFAPGMVALFISLRIPWRTCILAGLLGAAVFGLTLFYYPLRYSQSSIINLAGVYDANGVFQTVNLQTPAGILWLITGRQFANLFFQSGFMPSVTQIIEIGLYFIRNFLGFGVILGLWGGYCLYRRQRAAFWIWCAFFIPYTYFYTTYGAGDKQLMFGPSFLLWTILIGFGLEALIKQFPNRWVGNAVLILPVLMLVIFFPALDLHHETSVRDRAEALMHVIPADAVVFGNWADIVPIQYLHMIEKDRPDIRPYNLFLFPETPLKVYISHLIDTRQSVVFIASDFKEPGLPIVGWETYFLHYHVAIVPITLPTTEQVPLNMYILSRPT